MMLYLAVIALLLALVFLGIQVVWAWRLALGYPAVNTATPAEELPHAAIILSVRGADPSLVDCLRGLLRQDYPDYEVHIVIDSEHDPAWELLRPLLDEAGTTAVRLHLLDTKYETCSLKLSALAQAINELDASVRVVALIDADVIPYVEWLRDLVGPLQDPQVGAVTGLRWYLPESNDLGSLVRCLWNAAAISQQLAFRIPWGGSLAFRADQLRGCGLLDTWKQSFCEDTVSYGVLKRLGLRVHFVPAATMVNPESIELKHCLSFIRRQMLCVRLHHPHWRALRALGVGSALTLGLVVVVFIVALAVGDFLSAALMLGTLATFAVTMAAALQWIDDSLRLTARRRGETLPASSWKLALAAPLTQVVYLGALVSVSFLRTVEWRGVTYELNGPTPVRLTAYRPYTPAPVHADRPASVL